MNANPPVPGGVTTETVLHIHNRRLLWAARIVWWLIAALVIVTLLIVVPFYYGWTYDRTQTVEHIRTGLQQLGVSPHLRTIYYFSIRLLAILAYLSGAFVIFFSALK